MLVMIDFSHANSHEKQISTAYEVAGQIARGDERIIGVMIESNLVAGRQDIQADQELIYGQSETDACISWEEG